VRTRMLGVVRGRELAAPSYLIAGLFEVRLPHQLFQLFSFSTQV